jgi:hypothetical protein
MTSVTRYPIKAVAAFAAAPFLAFRVARFAKNPVRRGVGMMGLFLTQSTDAKVEVFTMMLSAGSGSTCNRGEMADRSGFL